jgi:hypothetical protein
MGAGKPAGKGKKRRKPIRPHADHRISMAVPYSQWRTWQRIEWMAKALGLGSVNRYMGDEFARIEGRLERQCRNAGIDIEAMQIKESPILATGKNYHPGTTEAPPGARLPLERPDYFDSGY